MAVSSPGSSLHSYSSTTSSTTSSLVLRNQPPAPSLARHPHRAPSAGRNPPLEIGVVEAQVLDQKGKSLQRITVPITFYVICVQLISIKHQKGLPYVLWVKKLGNIKVMKYNIETPHRTENQTWVPCLAYRFVDLSIHNWLLPSF